MIIGRMCEDTKTALPAVAERRGELQSLILSYARLYDKQNKDMSGKAKTLVSLPHKLPECSFQRKNGSFCTLPSTNYCCDTGMRAKNVRKI